MASPRLQRIIATLCPSLFFTLPATDDYVPVFSVAGLVATVLVFMFPGCLLAYLYNAVAYYYPRVIIFGVPPSIVQAMNAFPPILADRSFLATYAAALLATSPLVSWYLENAMVEETSQSRVAWDFAWVGRVIAFLESTLKSAVEKTEMLLDMLSGSRSRLEEELKRIDQELEEARRRAIEQRELTIANHKDEMERLRLELATAHQNTKQQQEAAFEKEREAAEAARKSHFKALTLVHRREEQQAAVSAKENERLKARITSAKENLAAITTAYQTDATRFEQQLAADESQYSALQGSLDFVTAEHRFHVEQGEQDRDNAQDLLEQQAAELDASRRTHASQIVAAQRLHDLQMSMLHVKNDLLKDRLASTITTRDSIMASYKAHIEQTSKRLVTHEVQYTALEGSLAFATAEHRIHVEHCDREHAQRKARIDELTSKLAVEQTARAELQAEHDGLKSRHAMVNEGYADFETKLKVTEHELHLEKQQHRAAIVGYRADQQVADALIDRLIAAPQKGQSLSSAPAPSLLRHVLVSQAAKNIKSEEPSESYAEQVTQNLPPSTLFDESWIMPHPDSIEGSTRVDVEESVPDFDDVSFTATSTPARPREDHSDLDSDTLAISSSESGGSDMSLLSMVDSEEQRLHSDSDGELSVLLSRSTQSLATSSSLSSLGLDSASSDMSLASVVEPSREEPLATSSGMTGSDMGISSMLGSISSDMSLASMVEGRHRPDQELSLLLSGSASSTSSSLSSLDLSLTSASDMSLSSVLSRPPQSTSSSAPPVFTQTANDSDLSFEPSLPPPPESSMSRFGLDESFGPPSAECSEASVSLELPPPLKAPSRSAVDLEPSLPSPPEDSLEASSSLFSLPDSSVAGASDHPSASALQEASLPLDALPSQDRLEASFSFDLGNESFGADVIAKSTPVFTRWVNMQRRSNAPESPTRDRLLGQSRSEVMLRVSQLFTEGWGFDVDDSDVVDVDKTRKVGE